MKKLKVLELFGGIGAPRKALENIGIELEHIDYVEVDKKVVDAYNVLYNENYESKDIKEWKPKDKNIEIDLLWQSSPCQDFSTAGKGDVSSGRSILYQEVLDIIENRLINKPKYIVWENVKGLLSNKNLKYFNEYLNKLAELGYNNTWKVINSKDFGIPQSRNRVFVVSIRSDLKQEFNWDKLIKKETPKLNEFLEKDVDIKYYITQKSMSKAIELGKVKVIDNICQTITTKQMRWNNSGCVKIPLHGNEMITVGGNNSNNKVAVPILESEFKNFENFITIPRQSDGELINGNHNRFWKDDKYVGTISSSTNSKVILPILDLECQEKESYFVLPRNSDGQVIDGSNNRYFKDEKIVNTLVSIGNTKLAIPILEVNKEYDYKMSDGTSRPIGKINNQGNITIPLTTNHSSNKVSVDCATTITTQQSTGKVITNVSNIIDNVPIFSIEGKLYYLRILTERECWRLMGWEDEYFNKVKNFPKTKLYHMAGNSIVIQVLEEIFKELLKEYL